MQAFNKMIDSYLVFWGKQETGKLDSTQSSLILIVRQYYHYLKLKKQINRVCQKINNNPSIDLSQDIDIQRLFEFWLGVDANSTDRW